MYFLSMNKQSNILIVDDHAEIRDALQTYLEASDFHVKAVANAHAMDQALARESFDLIILDVRMPGEDGLSICKRLRIEGCTPVLMLSALGDETDIIVGLEVGADDYMVKPFKPREVLARIRAILRRTDKAFNHGNQSEAAAKGYQFAHWRLDVDKRILVDESQTEIDLTTSEYQLLMAFVERPRAVLSRDRLLDLTSGRSAGPFDRAIDNQIMRLRKKVEINPDKPRLITTIRGGGYALSADVLEVVV
jgi:two-component system OmpR family response regulator